MLSYTKKKQYKKYMWQNIVKSSFLQLWLYLNFKAYETMNSNANKTVFKLMNMSLLSWNASNVSTRELLNR